MSLHGENSQKDQAEGRWYYLKVKMRKLEKTRKASAKSAIQIDNLYFQVICLSNHGKYPQ
jgi:hypothetical protein